MTQTVDVAALSVVPTAPATLADSGLSFDLVTELVLKRLHRSVELSGTEIAKQLGLAFSIVEPSLDQLKAQRLLEIPGGPTLGGASFRYRLTEAGHTRAISAFDRNQYLGAAPVPIGHYRRYMSARAIAPSVTSEQVRAAFAHLVVSDRVLDEIGPAVNGGQSIFIYGPPGNGKTMMAKAIRTMLAGQIAIPYAIDVGGSIIRFYDPAVHEPMPPSVGDQTLTARHDGRWILCRRPMVAVGGELTLEALSLAYNPRSGVYHAPVQALANGGVLLIDDFGRQRCSPRDLLNWWMVPLESHIECLTLQSGEKVEMPFMPVVIFSTNLKPSELVDEAFLRRIQYKIYAENPTPALFIEIFARCCEERNIPFERGIATGLVEGYFQTRGVELRACHPRDLIDQALSLAAYRRLPRRLTADLLAEACRSYFLDGHEAPRGAN